MTTTFVIVMRRPAIAGTASTEYIMSIFRHKSFATNSIAIFLVFAKLIKNTTKKKKKNSSVHFFGNVAKECSNKCGPNVIMPRIRRAVERRPE